MLQLEVMEFKNRTKMCMDFISNLEIHGLQRLLQNF